MWGHSSTNIKSPHPFDSLHQIRPLSQLQFGYHSFAGIVFAMAKRLFLFSLSLPLCFFFFAVFFFLKGARMSHLANSDKSGNMAESCRYSHPKADRPTDHGHVKSTKTKYLSQEDRVVEENMRCVVSLVELTRMVG